MIKIKSVGIGFTKEVLEILERFYVKELRFNDPVEGFNIPLKPRTPGRDTAVIDAVPKKDFLKNALAVCFLIH